MDSTLPHSQTPTCGVASIDAAHKELRAALARVAALPDAQFDTGFPSFVDAIEYDFRHEEILMEAIDYTGLRSHREEHARVLAALHQCERQVNAGDIGTGREALHLLAQWIVAHEARADYALGAAIVRAGRAGHAS